MGNGKPSNFTRGTFWTIYSLGVVGSVSTYHKTYGASVLSVAGIIDCFIVPMLAAAAVSSVINFAKKTRQRFGSKGHLQMSEIETEVPHFQDPSKPQKSFFWRKLNLNALALIVALMVMAYDPFLTPHFFTSLKADATEISLYVFSIYVLILIAARKANQSVDALAIGTSIGWLALVAQRIATVATQPFDRRLVFWLIGHLVVVFWFGIVAVRRFIRGTKIQRGTSITLKITSLSSFFISLVLLVSEFFPWENSHYQGFNGWTFKSSGTSIYSASCCYSSKSQWWVLIADYLPLLGLAIYFLLIVYGYRLKTSAIVPFLIACLFQIVSLLTDLGSQNPAKLWTKDQIAQYSLKWDTSVAVAGIIFSSAFLILIFSILFTQIIESSKVKDIVV